MRKHFNSLTPAEAERLAMLAEECAEVIQIVGKILRHGYESRHPDGGPNNRSILEREITDLMAVSSAMVNCADFRAPTPAAITTTWQKKLYYAHHQEDSDE